MQLNTNRHEFRETFRQVFKKMEENSLLTSLESQIANVIALHPEYHSVLKEIQNLEQDYSPEMGQANPFLHMALHLSIRDQIQLDRPAGSRSLFETLCKKTGSPHTAEHVFLECLAETLHQAARSGLPPDEKVYLEKLREEIN